jgi:pimeloyl-ACP methyl ester carboxylesterase
VAAGLLAEGYPVISASNPLRGVTLDSDYVAQLIDAIQGPIILVGHSYGGMVISHAANGKNNVRALVYVAAFAPDAGESAAALAGKFPGGTLGAALAAPVPLAGGKNDLYIDQAKFGAQFAADVPASEARLMGATQRPITDAALNEPAGVPAWKSIPSWFLYGSADKNIPAAALAFMAQRASARDVVVVENASHVVMVSNPKRLVRLIESADLATSRAER